ncbi:CDP-2,3-bis-(O-geranylgeranyl)-sn-glycerol synthase [Candidatus Micrarchaeota archaeon]|nr:CDP-2,3-bis-(O-geranylgeranyl)-sn-glycerol synthase [Candidatus Micrarchaeota archaeon]
MNELETALNLLIFIFPAYAANAAPVIFGNRGPVMDFKKKLWGKRVLGDGKTFIGFFAGLACGIVSGVAISFLSTEYYPVFLPFLNTKEKIVVGLLLSLGALTGDLAGSFIKRRLGIERGQPSFLMDQLPFLFMALFFTLFYKPHIGQWIGFWGFVFLVAATFILHKATNVIAYRLRLKKVPW